MKDYINMGNYKIDLRHSRNIGTGERGENTNKEIKEIKKELRKTKGFSWLKYFNKLTKEK